MPSEWDSEVTLTTLPRLQNSLENGDKPRGNLIITRDVEVLEAARNLVSAFEVTEPLVLAEVAEASAVGPSLAVWWTNAKGGMPQRVKLRVHQLSEAIGPEPKVPNTVTIKHKPKVVMTTLRLLAPQHYRQIFLGPAGYDTPSTVNQCWTRNLNCSVSQLTGGKWETLDMPKGPCLVGHLRVPLSLGQKAIECSGKQALFATLVSKSSDRDPVAWLNRDKEKMDEEHFRIAWASAEAQGLPLALRQSKNEDLGIVRGEQTADDRPRHYVLHGAPVSWDSSDVADFLSSVKWTGCIVLSRRRSWTKGANPEWIVKGRPPHGPPAESWSYSDIDCCLTIVPERHSKKKPTHSTAVKGPRKKWVDPAESAKPSVGFATTQLDSSGEEEEDLTHTGATTAVRSRERSRSPGKDRKASKQGRQKQLHYKTPDEQLLLEIGPWKFREAGGNGDCGFRAAATALQVNQGKPEFSSEELMRQASSLRLLAANHIAKHKESYAEHWAVDPNEDTAAWGGNLPPESFQSYLKMIARRETWIDEFLIRGLAERLGVPVVVWYFHPTQATWLRAVYGPWWREDVAQTTKRQRPLVLALKDKHYRALVPETIDDVVPESWLLRSEPREIGALKGAGPGSTALSICSATPERSRRSLSLASSTPRQTSKQSKRVGLPGQPLVPLRDEASTRSRQPCKAQALDVPQSTPCKTASSAMSIAEKPPKREHNKAGTTQARNQSFCSKYSSTKRKAESQRAEKLAMPGKKLPPVPKFHNDQRIRKGKQSGTQVFLWRCPLCSVEKQGPWKNICTMRWYHWSTHHKHVPYEQFLIKPRGAPVPVPSALLPEDQRAFSCPCCNVGLPPLETRHEILQCHPEITTPQWRGLMCSARFKGKKKSAAVGEAAARKAEKARKKRFKTHKPVELDLTGCNLNLRKGESRQWWCSECLQVLAGYGTNYTRKLLSCAQAKKDPKGPRRVKIAWNLVLQRDSSLKLQGQVSDWVSAIVGTRADAPFSKVPKHNKALVTYKREKLLWDGVEPHPGPSGVVCASGAGDNTLLWTLNVGGARGAWHVLNHLLDSGPPIILLQEVALPKDEAKGFSAMAFKKGFHCYYSGCEHTSHRPHGGALALVKQSLKSSPAWGMTSNEGAAQAVWVSGTLVCSVYAAPVPGNWKVVDEVSATLLSLPGEQKWILGGDFNCLPCENPLSPNLLGVSCDIFHPDVPTRWSSNRCIDYFCSNTGLSQVCALAHKVSDHKIVSVSWQRRLGQGDDYVVQSPPVLPKLGDEQPDSFTEAVDEAWREESSALLSDGSVDLKWDVLNKALYQTLLRAHKRYDTNRELNLPHGKYARGKPTEVSVRRRQVAHKPPAGHFTSFRQRTIRNLLGRMLEFRQRRQSEQPSNASRSQTQKLWNKIVRSPGYDDKTTLTSNIQRLERELDQCVAEENANRLQRWRRRTAVDHHAFRWLRRQLTETTHALKISKEDAVANCVQQALYKLQTFWTKVWNRPQLDRQVVWNEMARHLPPAISSKRWAPVTGTELQRAALSCKGAAAGLDGWTTEELLQFSDGMWQELAKFYLECENCSRVPKAWRQIRQVHLGKGKAKEHDGSMLTANLRPISVTSLIWRICCKARFRHKDTQAWMKRVMPKYVYGGVPGRGTQDAMGPLLYHTHRYWYVGTLDLEKAFDHADPVLATSVMKHCGLDPKIADMLCHNWTHQARWLQLLGQTFPECTFVSSSLPQGDSWSMAAMSFPLLPAAKDIQAAFAGVQQALFADDRSFACSTSGQLAAVSRKWGTWMQFLGLRENVGKAQYFHPTVKGRRALATAGLSPALLRIL